MIVLVIALTIPLEYLSGDESEIFQNIKLRE